ncbi:hypothetical protein [Weissella cibaria]|uniref:hypothetical protein n=1 Tax=Weissella cibaria TaxID=137591 RepID=UPI0011912D9A|nr:hypothetical protein [Weissella cibaria]TVV32041.1 hypothetical protein FO434_07280 [Weissella cibaria]
MVIIIEHCLEDVLQYSLKRVAVLENGKVTFFDNMPEILLSSGALHQYGLAVTGYLQVVKRTGADLIVLTGIRAPKIVNGLELSERHRQLKLSKFEPNDNRVSPLLVIDDVN